MREGRWVEGRWIPAEYNYISCEKCGKIIVCGEPHECSQSQGQAGGTLGNMAQRMRAITS